MWLNNKYWNKYWRRIIMGIWYVERPVGAAKLKGTIACQKVHRIFLGKPVQFLEMHYSR